MAILKARKQFFEASPNFRSLIDEYFDTVEHLHTHSKLGEEIITFHVEGKEAPEGTETEILVTFIRAGNKIIIKEWNTIEGTAENRAQEAKRVEQLIEDQKSN